MDLQLSATDLVQVGPCSFRNTMMLLPLGKKKKRQKLVVGDDNGELNCFEAKSSDIVNSWKMEPSNGKEIARIELGGSEGAKDKIFVSTGQQIYGISKKGKQFFLLNTNLSEVVTTMFIDDTKLYTGGEYIFNIFDNGKDVGFYMSSDMITDICCAYISRESAYDAVIASKNKKIQVLQDATPILEATLEGAVNEIHVNTKSSRAAGTGVELVYGTTNGRVGCLDVNSKRIKPTWLLPADKKGTVNCIQTFDLTNDGIADILIGRDDGSIQVYSFDMGDEPEKQFHENLGESIRSIDAGVVKNPEYEEIVLNTYSGRLVSYTSEPVHTLNDTDAYGRSKGTLERESQIVSMRKELDKLRSKLDKETEKIKKLAKSNDNFAMQKIFKVNSQFTLIPEEAGYIVTIEIPSPIDVVTLQSSIPIDLLDIESNEAIISRTPVSESESNKLLATCRCQETTNRFEFKVRTIEGQYGELEAIILARMEPKSAQSIKFQIKPLSLHHRIYNYNLDRKVNTINFTGKFTLGQMHEWMCRCLPEIPPRINDTEISMTFRNAFLGSILICDYKKGEATFQSDSVSTIAILKEIISKEATNRKMSISTTFNIEADTMIDVLQLLRPKLDYQLSLVRKVELIEVLKEIKLSGTDGISYLDEEYQDIVMNAEKYKKAFKNRASSLETLYGIVQDLYMDKFKFKGMDVRGKLKVLNELLLDYSFDKLLDFFMEE